MSGILSVKKANKLFDTKLDQYINDQIEKAANNLQYYFELEFLDINVYFKARKKLVCNGYHIIKQHTITKRDNSWKYYNDANKNKRRCHILCVTWDYNLKQDKKLGKSSKPFFPQ